MNELRISLPIVPPTATAQQKGVFISGGKPRFFERKHVKNARNDLMACLLPHRPQNPFSGALQVSVEFHYPFRRAERKSIIKRGMPIPHDRRPDLDNQLKLLLDCMTRLEFWRDDGQIAWLQARKLWSPRPRIEVFIFDMTTGANSHA